MSVRSASKSYEEEARQLLNMSDCEEAGGTLVSRLKGRWKPGQSPHSPLLQKRSKVSLEDLETENAALYRRLAERGESSDPQRNPSNDNIIAQGVMELFVPNGSSLSLAEEAGSSKDDILDADLRVQEPLDGSDDSLNPIDLELPYRTFGTRKEDFDELLRFVPWHLSDFLVQYHFKHLHWIHGTVHQPTYSAWHRQWIEARGERVEDRNIGLWALYFAILSTAAFFVDEATHECLMTRGTSTGPPQRYQIMFGATPANSYLDIALADIMYDFNGLVHLAPSLGQKYNAVCDLDARILHLLDFCPALGPTFLDNLVTPAQHDEDLNCQYLPWARAEDPNYEHSEKVCQECADQILLHGMRDVPKHYRKAWRVTLDIVNAGMVFVRLSCKAQDEVVRQMLINKAVVLRDLLIHPDCDDTTSNRGYTYLKNVLAALPSSDQVDLPGVLEWFGNARRWHMDVNEKGASRDAFQVSSLISGSNENLLSQMPSSPSPNDWLQLFRLSEDDFTL
ncbi:MAG: hypothetical protein CYPHOPRED_003824 [Cyphobasidiales sp. Tagirdzhanova-0007]|nr:MAG: hypothetical protein CYPHOPRED_003824 [Cyphobasidiales sp. Tagirdzhanova-0007]